MSIPELLRDLSEQLVMADPETLQDLGRIHALFDQFGQAAQSSGAERPATLSFAARDLTERMILNEVPDRWKAMRDLSDAASWLQCVLVERLFEADLAFPAAYPDDAKPAPRKVTPPVAVAAPSAGASVEDQPSPLSWPEESDEALFQTYLTVHGENLSSIEPLILELEQEDRAPAALRDLRRTLHTIKGDSGLLGLREVERFCHRLEDDIDTPPDDLAQMVDGLLAARDWLNEALEYYRGRGQPPIAWDRALEKIRGGDSFEFDAPATVVVPTAPVPTPAAAPANPAQSTVSVPPIAAESVPSDVPVVGDNAASPTLSVIIMQAKPLDPRKPFTSEEAELVGDFIAESREHLATAECKLLVLEAEPENDDAINSLFRSFHSIKGSAGFLELSAIERLAHAVENLLDKVRKREKPFLAHHANLTFDSIDTMKRLLSVTEVSLQDRRQTDWPADVALMIQRVRFVDGKLGWLLMELGMVTQAQLDFAMKNAKPGRRIGDTLVDLRVASREQVDFAISLQEGKLPNAGNAGSSQNVPPSSASAAASAPPPAPAPAGSASVAGPGAKLGEILVAKGAVQPAQVERALDTQANHAPPKLGEVLVKQEGVPARAVAEAVREQQAPALASGAPTGPRLAAAPLREPVRVDADRLDRIIEMIGELVISCSMIERYVEAKDPDAVRKLSQLKKITRELQESGTSLRLLPIRPVFQKMNRLARDLSKKINKPVRFVMEGEETELDKAVIDLIADPLVHMVRNAMDHGLEAEQDDRIRAGKSPDGTVTLRAYHRSGNVHIELEDDGRGMDPEKLIAKAREKGLISEKDQLDRRQALELIFAPGFSTAKAVTDVSGRGVGMDVVKRNIEALRGTVSIQSEVGKGSIFTIRLPLTLAIIDGMLVRVANERFILPTLSVVITIRPVPGQVVRVLNGREMFRLQEKLIPLIRLNRVFGSEEPDSDPECSLVVVVEAHGQTVAVMVDELIGQQQIVIKSLGDAFTGVPGIAGGAILPDGRVGVILDMSGLIQLASPPIENDPDFDETALRTA
jgi:two-component system chemotaxis sensor kinase CheA